MSYEETMVCDGCSTVVAGGRRRAMLRDLREQGGERMTVDGRERHLCACCVEYCTTFFDGTPIPGATSSAR